MIVIRFMGGLGNQMFQYALGRHLSLIHGRPLRFDASGYTESKPDPRAGVRLFGLPAYTIQGEVATPDELKHFLIYRTPGAKGRIARRANSWTLYHRRRYVIEQQNEFWHFCRRVLTSPLADPVCMVGYWQTEKYFEEIAATIRKDLTLKVPAAGENADMLSVISAVESVSVHVRHGDNATSTEAAHGVLPVSYYQRAASLVSEQLHRPHFFVFSDDPIWAQEALTLPGPTRFVTHNGDEKNYEDLRLMTACKHHIVGNSTFSWWGAWLGKKEHQMVYAPKKYHVSANRDYRDYYPAGWNLLAAG